MKRFAWMCLFALSTAACGQGKFSEPLTLGGQVIQPDILSKGQNLYNRFCSTCHGYDGKADTAQARQLSPKPRDLTVGEFKHKDSGPETLPTDADLARVIRNGVPGTGMPAWPNLSDQDIHAVSQYLKTFSDKWRAPKAPAAP
jgi:mono/diheme cytochrome c family protein